MKRMCEDYDQTGFKIYSIFSMEQIKILRCFILEKINSIAEPGGRNFLNWQKLLSGYNSIDLHHALASKQNRILPKTQADALMNFECFSLFESILGRFCISNEENNAEPEIYWRLTRPGENSDIGPLHADGWFWDINKSWKMPEGFTKRSKVWIPLQIENGKNGFKLVKGSHRDKSIKYSIINIDGKNKPVIQSETLKGEAELVSMQEGEIILFHDRIIHGGAENHGNYIRVSLEFTCCHN